MSISVWHSTNTTSEKVQVEESYVRCWTSLNVVFSVQDFRRRSPLLCRIRDLHLNDNSNLVICWEPHQTLWQLLGSQTPNLIFMGLSCYAILFLGLVPALMCQVTGMLSPPLRVVEFQFIFYISYAIEFLFKIWGSKSLNVILTNFNMQSLSV